MTEGTVKTIWWIEDMPPQRGGIETFVARVGPALRDLGQGLHILMLRGGPAEERFADIPVQRLPIVEAMQRGDLHQLMTYRRQIAQYKRSVAPDLYHLHLSGPTPLLHLQTLEVEPAPMLLTLHNEMFRVLNQAGSQSLFGQLLDQAAIITTVSCGSASDLLAERPDLAARLVVVPNGTAIGAAPTPPPPANLVLSVGRLGACCA